MKDPLVNIKERLSIFKDLYNEIRIVDSNINKVIGSNGHNLKGNCFDFWGKEVKCENCISSKAAEMNTSFVKIELRANKIYLVQAIPTQIKNKTVIVEMLKDITINSQLDDAKNSLPTSYSEVANKISETLIRDELTGLYNRRFVNKCLPLDLNSINDSSQPLAVIFADIDHFKQVNDIHGHNIGDCVLREFAKLLKENIRGKTDWVARYGGEEFIILLKEIPKDNILSKIDEIRKLVSKKIFCQDIVPLRITCSFGVSFVNSNAISSDKVIEVADKCLYEAKRTGRNKVVFRDLSLQKRSGKNT